MGAAVALALAEDHRPLAAGLEALGGALAGDLGGQLPDEFDPPLHGYHRSLGHGVVPCLTAGRAMAAKVTVWQRSIRSEGALNEQRWRLGVTENERLDGFVRMIVCRLLVGALPGLIAGYASHLVLDLGTPRRLPLIG